MKEIKAIVQQFMAEKVINSLREDIAHLPGITVSLVNGFSRNANGDDHVEDGR